MIGVVAGAERVAARRVFVVEVFLEGEDFQVFGFGYIEAGHFPAEVCGGRGQAEVVGDALFGSHEGLDVAFLFLLEKAEFFGVGREAETLHLLLNLAADVLVVLLDVFEGLAFFGGEEGETLVIPPVGVGVGAEETFGFLADFALEAAGFLALLLGLGEAVLLTAVVAPPRFVGVGVVAGVEGFEAGLVFFPDVHLDEGADHVVVEAGGAEEVAEGLGVVGVEGGDEVGRDGDGGGGGWGDGGGGGGGGRG